MEYVFFTRAIALNDLIQRIFRSFRHIRQSYQGHEIRENTDISY